MRHAGAAKLPEHGFYGLMPRIGSFFTLRTMGIVNENN
jgi:hypothetical protein